jgi:hypothetical protein
MLLHPTALCANSVVSGDLMGVSYNKRDNGHDQTNTRDERHSGSKRAQRLLTEQCGWRGQSLVRVVINVNDWRSSHAYLIEQWACVCQEGLVGI